jgi:hypothetical protein
MTQYVKLDKLRPNNWFLDKAKLDGIREVWQRGDQYLLPAVVVTLIDNEYSLVDGHCRAYVALENGAWGILAEIVEPDELTVNPKLLTIFHRQGPFIGIRNVGDLGKRIIDSEKSETPPDHISRRLGHLMKEAVG